MKTVVACGALAIDVRRIARRRGWELKVVPVPALLHNHPDRIAAAVAARFAGDDVVAVAYGDYGTYGALDGLRRLEGDSCYDVFAREEVAAALAEEPGTYFLTDFLARTFEHTVWRELGLGPPPGAARGLFPELHPRDVAGPAAGARDASRRRAGGGAARAAAGRARGGLRRSGARA